MEILRHKWDIFLYVLIAFMRYLWEIKPPKKEIYSYWILNIEYFVLFLDIIWSKFIDFNLIYIKVFKPRKIF